ncbi:MAG: AraC family transcriptional regulator [Gemmatimonadota bacterium]|nr:AraC family transcriptional regulator [Gemmatimonadota bacterium]
MPAATRRTSPGDSRDAASAPELVLTFASRDRVRVLARGSVQRRHGRVVMTKSVDEFRAAFAAEIVDAAVVDLAAPSAAASGAALLAREFPSVAFIGVLPYRVADAPRLAECAALDFADIIADGIDDGALRPLVAAHGFSVRFADALRDPPSSLGLSSTLQLAAWRCICAHTGRALGTERLATTLGVSREHLSRSFAASGSNLKRVADLVRVLAAAELAKNPGYDSGDVARVLGFATLSQLTQLLTRTAGVTVASLSRLRAVDLIQRFMRSSRRSGERSGSDGGQRP